MSNKTIIAAMLVIAAFTAPASAMSRHDREWVSHAKGLIAASIQQNGGTPSIVRRCFPQYGKCETEAYAMFGGIMSTMITAEDTYGKTVGRYVCHYNETADVKRCTDYDRGSVSITMKGQDGLWYPVANK
jgi:hypothetical protein